MIAAQLLLLAGLVAPGIVNPPSPTVSIATPRVRIVPQTTDGLLQDIEESLDGTRLITHDKQYAPRLWDARRQILLTVLGGHPDRVFRVGFSPDGTKIFTLSNLVARIWDSSRAKLLGSHACPKDDTFTQAVFAPDASRLALATSSGKIQLISTSDAANSKTLGQHTKRALSLAFSPDGSKLASGAEDGTGRVWDVLNAKPLWQIKGHVGPIAWIYFSPDGKTLLSSGLSDGKALLFDSETGNQKSAYTNVVGRRDVANVQMGALFVGKDGSEIAAADDIGAINIYKAGESKPAYSFEGHDESVREMRATRDGHFLASYGGDETLKVWDVWNRKEVPITLEAGLPTAGEFSPNSDIFWLGYDGGEIHRYDLATGKASKSTYGDVVTLSDGLIGKEGLWLRSEHEVQLFSGKGEDTEHFYLNLEGSTKPLCFQKTFENESLSPDGRYLAATSRRGDYNFFVFDLATDRVIIKLKNIVNGFAWSPDGTRIAIMPDEGDVGEISLSDGTVLNAWTWPIDKNQGELSGIAYHPNGHFVVTTGHPKDEALLWDMDTGKEVKSLGKFSDQTQAIFFTPDGSRVTVLGWIEARTWATAAGAVTYPDFKETEQANSYSEFRASADGERIVAASTAHVVVFEPKTGKVVFLRRHPQIQSRAAADLAPDGKRVLVAEGTVLREFDVDLDKEIRAMPHQDEVTRAEYLQGGSRVFTVDRVGGGNIFDAATGAKRASIVLMKRKAGSDTNSWLVYDNEGRYDAPDPSNVTGAYFVLDWEGGLEPISMPQLKSEFYEPGLLAKVLGINKEPLRDVPSLESLRLYPDLAAKAGAKPLVWDITATDRDGGGVGKLTCYLNGKQFFTKKGAPYVQLDLADYVAYMLPQTSLPEGSRGNVLSVTVTNEKGDLMSPPLTVDVGVPAQLKAPDVHLYALFAGVGDYPGTSSDLGAPPSDASELGLAVKTAGERLLPGHVDVSVLTTANADASQRPTRTNIVSWFKATAAKASSSDIVLVFFAGHGTDKIADQTDYFFLTSDANPAEMSASSASTATIRGEDLKTMLSAIAANKQVVILDTCHSGAASKSLIDVDRSVSGDYQRAWEAIKDATGTYLLAGSASDQKSYESASVDHGMLTYSLLEAMDRGSGDGLRQTANGDLFVDVDRWLSYAANRVESLKTEVGVKGVQRPEFKRSAKGSSFDIGVLTSAEKGFLKLPAPKPIVIVGSFESSQEDPLDMESAVAKAMADSKAVKPWFDIAKHPGVYRMAADYAVVGDKVSVKLYLQRFDQAQKRATLQNFELEGAKDNLSDLATRIRVEIEKAVTALEKPAGKP